MLKNKKINRKNIMKKSNLRKLIKESIKELLEDNPRGYNLKTVPPRKNPKPYIPMGNDTNIIPPPPQPPPSTRPKCMYIKFCM